MNLRLALVLAGALAGGVTLLCTEFRWGRHRPLAGRLAPYGGLGTSVSSARGAAGLVALVVPFADGFGRAIERLAGVRGELAVRLARSGSNVDPLGHRLRRLVSGTIGLAAGLVAVVVTDPSSPLAVVAVSAATGLGLLVPDQRLHAACERAEREVAAELPVVLEQLATLLDAGLSVSGSLQRLADRGAGRCAQGFREVGTQVRHGVPESVALERWAAVVGVPGARRLCTLLTIGAPDLGRLLEAEARQLRRDAHRQLVERMERRSQQVWIPVTVATLVPGVLFLAVPFIEAMRLFSAA